MPKTRKARSSSVASKKDLVVFFLELLTAIKIYHWNTYDYSAHKATDDLYSSLSGHIDKFMEVYMGTTNQRIPLSTRQSLSLLNLSKPAMKTYIQKGIHHLEKIRLPSGNTDLYNIRDEMLGDLNQFLYLFTFK
jgi:DNA-binding ferritin-like protein